MVENEERVAQLILEIQYAKIKEMCAKVVIGLMTLNTILDTLGYKKFCAKWVSQMLMTDHKEQRVWSCADLLEPYEPVDCYFLTASLPEVRHGHIAVNQNQSSSLWNGNIRFP
jgi:hypothetical protein